jgi:hypothetical protein
VRAIGNAGQRTTDLVQHVGVAIKISNREFTFTCGFRGMAISVPK